MSSEHKNAVRHVMVQWLAQQNLLEEWLDNTISYAERRIDCDIHLHDNRSYLMRSTVVAPYTFSVHRHGCDWKLVFDEWAKLAPQLEAEISKLLSSQEEV